MISENTRMSRVTTALPMATDPEPKMTRICAPTPAAPTVWAMVLSVRIAARGRSMLAFIRLSRSPLALPSLASSSTCDCGTDRMPASSSEQRNETPSARAR